MSYIRCLSNPEGLYIWSDVDGTVKIAHTVKAPLSSSWPVDMLSETMSFRSRGTQIQKVIRRHNPPKPVGRPPLISVPRKSFERVCRQWIKDEDDISFRGISVRELMVDIKTGQPIEHIPMANRAAHLIRFQYKDQWFYMWRVTWAYVCHDIERRDRWEQEHSRRPRKRAPARRHS